MSAADARAPLTILLGRVTDQETGVELFPDPAQVFAEWSDELAARILPVLGFDRSVLDPEQQGPAWVLYTEDWRCSFLSYQVRDGRLCDLDPSGIEGGVAGLRAFQERPDPAALVERLKGRYLELTPYTVEVGAPADSDDFDWNGRLEEALRDASGERWPLALPRFGGYPVYVQATGLGEPYTIDVELPTDFLGLAPCYLYLSSSEDGQTRYQEMQMT